MHGQEIRGGPGTAIDEILPREGEARARERGDHEAVPGGEDLAIGQGRRAPRAYLAQDRPDALEERLLVRVGRAGEAEHVRAFEIARLRGVEDPRRARAVL